MSLRYHVISIVAVFLALAVGVVLGASGLSDRLLSAVSADRDSLSTQVDTLTAERDGLLDQQAAADQFAARIGPAAVKGTLSGKSVALVLAGSDQSDAESVIKLLGQAGATVTGSITLTDAVGDPGRSDQLDDLTARLLPAGAQLPAAADTGSLAGGLLGSVMTTKGGATAQQAGAVWTGLADTGFVRPGTAPGPADLIVVLTGGAEQGIDAGDSAAILARLAAELDRAGAGAVLAGRDGSASATGPIGVARAAGASTAGLSTVDDVQTGSGRVAAVLALSEQLNGKAGSYGSDRTASGGASPGA